MALWAIIVGAQILIAMRPGPLRLVTRGVLVLAAFPIVGGVLALALGLATGYWA